MGKKGQLNFIINVKSHKGDQYILAKRYLYIINLTKYATLAELKESVFEHIDKIIPAYHLERFTKEFPDFMKKHRKNDEAIDVDDFPSLLKKIRKSPDLKKFRIFIIQYIEGLLTKITEKQIAKSHLLKCLNELVEMFNLSEVDQEVILIRFFVDNENVCSDLFQSLNNYREIGNRVRLMEVLTGFNNKSIMRSVAQSGKLQKYGLIEADLDLETHIADFFNGLSDKTLQSTYFAEYDGATVGLEMYKHINEHSEIVRNLLCRHNDSKKGLNILLYGSPGVGKTEFARSLGKDMNMNTYEVFHSSDNRTGERFSALQACINCTVPEKSLIIVDEADEMLNGTGGLSWLPTARNTQKGVINDVLDTHANNIIWITNTYSFIEDSTRRRFDYSIEFPKITKSMRRRIWQNGITKYRLKSRINKETLEYLVEQYDISAGGIDLGLRNIKRVLKSKSTKTDIRKLAAKIIGAHQKIMSGKNQLTDRKKVNSQNYSIKGLNIKSDINLDEVMEILQEFSLTLDSNQDQPVKNINLLLHGQPGTGKTEFAKYISRTIERPLIIKRGSDLLDMYVGGTEQRIKSAFEEAEGEKAVLLIDEADGLLSERKNSHRNFEVTQVNEFLSQMEDFNGILICTSNFKKNLDSAAIRRFNLKVEFDCLNDEGKSIFFKRLLQEVTGHELSDYEKHQLLSITNLTPGDFKVVWQKYCFFRKEKLSNTRLINALQSEVSNKNMHKSNSIGFNA